MARRQQHEALIVKGARENNLQHVNAVIPKHRITVFTGVSGSGKSSLVFDTIAAESQRQLNETYSAFIRNRLPHYGQPDVDRIENLSVAIVVDQKRLGGNARSTVGTVTDINSLLRLLFSRVGKPFVGYSNIFSFNHPEGMCPRCEGIGTVRTIDIDRLVDRSRSLNEGAILFPTFAPGGAFWKRYVLSGLFDNDKKLADYTDDEWQLLLYQEPMKPPHPLPGWYESTMYEGLITRFSRIYMEKAEHELKGSHKKAMDHIVAQGPCPECHGTRLNSLIRSCKIGGKNIADCAAMQVSDLIDFVGTIEAPVAATLVPAIVQQLGHLVSIGLGYLTLARETATLSGGESQRVKMVRHLGSSLIDITYIFDEPSIGLHPSDVHQLNTLMRHLRDKGNTVLIVEHDPDVIAIADHIIDMGPGAGSNGGHIVFEGSLRQLRSAPTLTGQFLSRRPQLKAGVRPPAGWLSVKHARLHNLQDVSVDIPRGVLTAVTGVAGSGKSTLINGVLPAFYPGIVFIDQRAIGGSKRSTPATYTGLLDPIRELFAVANGVSASLFSANSKGACPECKGLGVIYTDLAFMDPIVTTCEACRGQRFTDEVLRYTLRGRNIHKVLEMSVAEARTFFSEEQLQPTLRRLGDVGLDYLTLGQPLNTLSGGERQRIKLATELENSGQIYVLDEPTTGLHMSDVARIIGLMDRLVDNGSTVIVIEHNLDVVCQADWVVDMGPGAGRNGGRVIFSGEPAALTREEASATGRHLRKHVG